MSNFSQISLAALLFATVFAHQKRDSPECPGVLFNHAGVSGCCVGGDLPDVDVSTCAGWPVCTGPVTTTVTYPPLSCATVVTYTGESGDSAYTSAVEAASSSLAASGTVFRTTVVDAQVSGASSSDDASSPTITDASSASAASGASATVESSSSAGGEGRVMAAVDMLAAAGLAVVAVL